VKAGARSAIATLWHINDGATEQLMREFYSKWPGTDKARALQLAQQQLLKDPWFRHPAYWAPFLLINDWR
jgi:CHAT domain-containing protein